MKVSQQSVARYFVDADRTRSPAPRSGVLSGMLAGWKYPQSLPLLTDRMNDERPSEVIIPDGVRAAHLQAAARRVNVVYARPRTAQIVWADMARDAEALHIAEALGDFSLLNGVKHRMAERGVLSAHGFIATARAVAGR